MVNKAAKSPKAEKHIPVSFEIPSFLKRPWVWTFLLLIIPMILAVVVRMPPASLPITRDWAEQSVQAMLRNQIASEINKQHPNLPEAQKKELLDEMYAKMSQERASEIAASVEQAAAYFRSQLQSAGGHTYILGIDEYHFLRRGRNVVETGRHYDELRNGTPYDNHMIAPLGVQVNFELYPYILGYWHKFTALFGETDLERSAFLVPIIFCALAVIPTFFLAKRFAGLWGGFTAGTLVGVLAPIVARTSGGGIDTDMFPLFFPLFIGWLFIEAMEAKQVLAKIGLALLSAAAVGVFATLWHWWFIFNLIIVVIIGFFVFHIFHSLRIHGKLKLPSHVVKNIYTSLAFIIASAFFVSLHKGLSGFLNEAVLLPYRYYFLKATGFYNLWPNVMTTVAELNPLSLAEAVRYMGGAIFFSIALIGLYFIAFDFSKLTKNERIMLLSGSAFIFLVVLGFPSQNPFLFIAALSIPFIARYAQMLFSEEKTHIEFSILMFSWFMFTLFACTRGVRFTLLLAPSFCIGTGVFIGKIFKLIEGLFATSLGIGKSITRPALALILIGILYLPFSLGYKTGYSQSPLINDAWVEALEKIRNESAPNAIISSWWDYGHWFKYYADRAVIFDGASQNAGPAHWIGLALLTDEENLTIGILRMLSCGSNRAYETLNAEWNDTRKTVETLYQIIRVDKARAADILKAKGIAEARIAEVLKLTHCQPPEHYFITSDDMIGKSGVWAHFGSWDFLKAEMYFKTRGMSQSQAIQYLEKNYNLSNQEATRIFFDMRKQDPNNWIAPWPSYVTGAASCMQREDELLCVHNVQGNILPFSINLKTMNASIATEQGAVYPTSFVYPTENGYAERVYSGKTIGVSLALIPPSKAGGAYQSVLMEKELALSTFNKLYYYGGHGMRCFKPFDSRTQLTGGPIYVWKVDWECTQQSR